MTKINDHVHGVSLGPVNVFLVKDGSDLVLIDTGLPGNADKILEAVRMLERTPGDLKNIILTHAHPDHIGSAAALVAATGAKTWMHPADAPIAEGREAFRPVFPAPDLLNRTMHFAMSLTKPALVEPVTVDHPMVDGAALPFTGSPTAIHVPGHCAGQCAILWKEYRTLFVADCCAHLFGLGEPIGYENRNEGLQSLKRLAELEFEFACFGHGRAILKGADRQFRRKWANSL